MDLSRGYGLTDHDRALLDLLVGVASVVRDRVGFPGMALGREHDAAVALLLARIFRDLAGCGHVGRLRLVWG